MKNKIFTELYIKYHRLVIKSVMEQTGDYELAQEICQQVYLKLYDKMRRVDIDFVKTWLLLTTKHLVIDHSRTARVRKEVIMPDSTFNTVLDYTLENVIERSADKEFIFSILTDLKSVNKKWYEAICMIEVDGLTQEETSRALGISVTILRARVYRAKQYLRKKYGEEYLARK